MPQRAVPRRELQRGEGVQKTCGDGGSRLREDGEHRPRATKSEDGRSGEDERSSEGERLSDI